MLAGDTFTVARNFLDKIRSHTCTMSGRVLGMEPSSCVATVRREFKPHRRSRGEINRTRGVVTTHSGDLCTQTRRPVIYFQHIITRFRVKLKELHFDAVATGYCNTPGASLVVEIIVGVLRTRKASGQTSIPGRGTSCEK